MSTKSPFYVIKDFISPLNCEDIIFRLNHTNPDYDEKDNPIKTVKNNRLSDYRVLPYIENIIPDIEEYYEFERQGILPLNYEWFVQNFEAERPRCENSAFINNKWVRINDYDLTGIIFLNDYQDTPPFDDTYEVVGGKLEFLNHNFAFNPNRGSLIIFPGNEYFINNTSPILAGALNQIRFHIVGETPLIYDPDKFNGTYKDWFS